ncbi:MAG: alpha/beta hydrolase [Bdellovibrionales bacterium]|jgi:pimeloyl-ACP methyl ester carboxylesterase
MEVIHFGSQSDNPPLLFVHGSYCGAWIWERFFLPAFTQAGWRGAAISLRGHGESEGREKIDSYGISDYLEDIETGTRLFNSEPIIIGHSLGGYLAQKFALERSIKGLVLLSSPSLLGLQGSVQHVAAHRPMLAMQLGILMTMGSAHADLRMISDALFCNSKDAEKLESFLPLLQKESSRVMMEASWPDFRTPKIFVPTLALGGDEDCFVPEFEYRYEAQFWKGDSKVLRGVSHGVMLDSCWPEVMREILGWLTSNFPQNSAKT